MSHNVRFELRLSHLNESCIATKSMEAGSQARQRDRAVSMIVSIEETTERGIHFLVDEKKRSNRPFP